MQLRFPGYERAGIIPYFLYCLAGLVPVSALSRKSESKEMVEQKSRRKLENEKVGTLIKYVPSGSSKVGCWGEAL